MTAWGLDQSWDSSLSVATEDSAPSGLAFKPDGSRLYMIGTANDQVCQYDLSTPWAVSTASLVGSLAPGIGNPHGIAWKPDGTKFWIVSPTTDRIHAMACSTAWDATTGVEDAFFSLLAQDTFMLGVAWRDDGTRFYTCGNGNDRVYQYNCSTAWDVTTATFSTNFSVAGQDTAPQDIQFKPDGTKMFVAGGANNTVYRYSLGTAWNLATASYDSVSVSVAAKETGLSALAFKDDGNVFYVSGDISDAIHQYGAVAAASRLVVGYMSLN